MANNPNNRIKRCTPLICPTLSGIQYSSFIIKCLAHFGFTGKEPLITSCLIIENLSKLLLCYYCHVYMLCHCLYTLYFYIYFTLNIFAFLTLNFPSSKIKHETFQSFNVTGKLTPSTIDAKKKLKILTTNSCSGFRSTIAAKA